MDGWMDGTVVRSDLLWPTKLGAYRKKKNKKILLGRVSERDTLVVIALCGAFSIPFYCPHMNTSTVQEEGRKEEGR